MATISDEARRIKRTSFILKDVPIELLEQRIMELRYDPNQPRDPKGDETGGQWAGKSSVSTKSKYKDIVLSTDDYPDVTIGSEGLSKDGKFYTVYHATPEKNLDSIKKTGLKKPSGIINSTLWFMTSTSPQLEEYLHGAGGVIIEYRIPINEVPKYLWSGLRRNEYKPYGYMHHAIKDPLPGDFINNIKKIGGV